MGSVSGQKIVVFGAYGHTGRFVVAELLEKGYVPILSGRDPEQLRELAASHPGLDVRPASVDDPGSLDRALAGAAAVINCAGPFAATAAPVIEAALRAGVPYVDVAAEIEANLDTFTDFAERARAANALVIPAMAFFGGLSDLLVTAALGDWTSADEVHIAYGLSSWHPTAGTRTAGTVSRDRRNGRRVRYSGGQVEYHEDALPTLKWSFPEPMGTREVIGEFSMADIVTVPSHLDVPEVHTYMAAEAARDLAAADTPAPEVRVHLQLEVCRVPVLGQRQRESEPADQLALSVSQERAHLKAGPRMAQLADVPAPADLGVARQVVLLHLAAHVVPGAQRGLVVRLHLGAGQRRGRHGASSGLRGRSSRQTDSRWATTNPMASLMEIM